jgi:hypothetical protein|tara:strand:+ start:93 stop:503 length:411 start_codon:yes stop_codon:yes gene_type:complete
MPHSRKRRRKRKRKRKTRVQHGGILPVAAAACAPCVASAAASSASMLGAGVTAGLGSAFLVKKSITSERFKGKTISSRREEYKIKKGKKWKKKTFIQKGRVLTLSGKKIKCRSVKEARARFDKAIDNCIKIGFDKC